MGEALHSAIAKSSDMTEAFTLDKNTNDKERLHALKAADLVFDFTTAKANAELLALLKQDSEKSSSALLIGTTGLTDSIKSDWQKLANEKKIKVLVCPNTSLGILLTLKMALIFSKIGFEQGFDLEVLESHHREKIDSPSGTALWLAGSIAKKHEKQVIYGRTGKRKKDEIGVSALRGGLIFGEHELRFVSDDEEISLSHRAFSRNLFASGALFLGRWLVRQEKGYFFTLEDVLSDLT